MSTIQNLFEQAQLAEAAYADFASYPTTAKALEAEGMSTAQATAFTTDWSVVDQYNNSSWGGLVGTGFSATLFRNTTTGQYSLAIRGSQQLNDFYTDSNLILNDGVASAQLVDLYNYWQRINTPAGATYTAAKLVPATGAQPVIKVGGFDYEIQMVDSSQLSDSAQQFGTGMLNVCPASIDVCGHSLGGHLAMAFSRLFPSTGVNSTAINGLGFKVADASVNNLFAALGGAPGFDSGKIQNIYGIDGPEFASMNNSLLQQPGGWDGIYIESGGLGTIGGHSATQMTDSLAVYNLFAQLDPSLNTAANGLQPITNILKASSNVAANTLESAVSALGKLFNVPATSNVGSARDDLYVALNAIQNCVNGGYTIAALDGVDAATLAANAQTDIAYRYALQALNPFAIIGADYSSFDTNGTLDIYDPASGAGALSKEWLADRAAMLGALIAQNIADTNCAPYPVDTIYSDAGSGITVRPSNGGHILDSMQKQIRFGSDAANTLDGGMLDDRLYGMGGDDTLSGNGGKDYLEGGQGVDTLNGDANDDTLMGGSGSFVYDFTGVQVEAANARYQVERKVA